MTHLSLLCAALVAPFAQDLTVETAPPVVQEPNHAALTLGPP